MSFWRSPNLKLYSLISRLISILKSFIFHLCCVTFAILNVVLIPALGILVIPVYIHRYAAAQLAKIFRTDLAKMLTTFSTNFMNDLLFTRPACYTIISLTFSGNMALHEFISFFGSRVLPAQLPNGDLRYPELQQYPYQWMGFKFWKPESDFKIEEHVYELDKNKKEHLTPHDLQRIRQNLNIKPFAKDKSPWEILLVHNCIPTSGIPFPEDVKQTVIIFKIHHGMADGYSIMKLLVEILSATQMPKNAEPKYVERSRLRVFLYWSSFPFRAVCSHSWSVIALLKERTYWRVPFNKRSPSVHAISNPIPISRVKACKDKHGVAFTSVVYGLCTLSTKSWMTMENIPVPDWMRCALPFPMPGHSSKLRNFMSQVTPRLPFGLHDSPVSTLKSITKLYKDLKNSTSPTWNFFMAKALGGLYAPLCNAIARPLIPSILLTNFPAQFDKPLTLGDYECTDAFFFCGLLDMPGLGFYILTYVDTLTVVVAADSSLMSESQVQQLADFIETELQNLEDSPATCPKPKQDVSSIV